MTVDDHDAADILRSVEGEISFFRAIMRARPVGIHRHFHMITIQSSIFKDTRSLVPIADIWQKIRSCYDIDALEAIVSDSLSWKFFADVRTCLRTWKLDMRCSVQITLYPYLYDPPLPPPISLRTPSSAKNFLYPLTKPSRH